MDNDNGHAARIFGKKESELAMQAGTGLMWLSVLVAAAILLPNFLVEVPVSPTRVETVVNWGALWSSGFYGILLAGLGWTVRIGGRILDRTGI